MLNFHIDMLLGFICFGWDVIIVAFLAKITNPPTSVKSIEVGRLVIGILVLKPSNYFRLGVLIFKFPNHQIIKSFYTLFSFHFPRLNIINAMIVRSVSAITIDKKTPFSPTPKGIASK